MNTLKPVSEIIEEAKRLFDVAKASAGKPISFSSWLTETITQDRQHTKDVLIEGLRGMREVHSGECPECKGAGHLGHDLSDQRPEHINDGDCRTCPVRCPACEGTGVYEMPNLEHNQAIDQAIALVEQTYKSNA